MSGGNLKLPAHVLFRKDLSLMLWKPHGILDEVIVNEIMALVTERETAAKWLSVPVEVLMAQR
jgi:hypothetical protein